MIRTAQGCFVFLNQIRGEVMNEEVAKMLNQASVSLIQAHSAYLHYVSESKGKDATESSKKYMSALMSEIQLASDALAKIKAAAANL